MKKEKITSLDNIFSNGSPLFGALKNTSPVGKQIKESKSLTQSTYPQSPIVKNKGSNPPFAKLSNYLSFVQSQKLVGSIGQALKTEYDGQQLTLKPKYISQNSSSKALKTQPSSNNQRSESSNKIIQAKSDDANKKIKTVQQQKQHLRLSSLNEDPIVLNQVKQKMSLGDLQEKLFINTQPKSSNDLFKVFYFQKIQNKKKVSKGSETTKHTNTLSNDFLGKFSSMLPKTGWKQQSSYIQEMLRTHQKNKLTLDLNNNNNNQTETNVIRPYSKPSRTEFINIILVDKNKKSKLQVDVSVNNISWLVQYIKQETEKNDQSKNLQGSTFIGIKTYFSSTPLDYILSMPDLPLQLLSLFPNQPIVIQPLYSIPRELKSKKVGLKDFDFIRCIGSGGFSKVYLVRERSSGVFYAMKLIEKYSIFQQNKQCIVQNERTIMETVGHPFIVKMYYAFESENYLIFVLEYCQGGELFFLLRQIKRMKEEQAFFYFTQICLAMKCLHDRNIIYRDIKPENILIDIYGNVRIADFGLSKPNMADDILALIIYKTNFLLYRYSFCGSPEYMAPEMLLKQGHNQLLDLYCLGALLFELVTGLPPFYCKNTEEIYQRIVNQKLTFPQSLALSPQIKDLLNRLLMKEPKYRLESIDMIFMHPWIQQFGGMNSVRDIMSMKQKPPFSPDYFRYNFDEEEFGKGEQEFLYKIKLLQNTVQENYPRETLVPNFYYNFYELAKSPVQSELESVRLATMNYRTEAAEDEREELKQYSHRSGTKAKPFKSTKRLSTIEEYIAQLQNSKSPSENKQALLLKHLRLQTEVDQKKKNDNLKF